MTLGEDSYSNLAGDGGILWDASPALRLGASLDNAGSGIGPYIADSVVRLGATYIWDASSRQKVSMAGGLTWEPYGVTHLQIGAEDAIDSLFFLRAGYVGDLADSGLDGLSGFTAGLGIRFQDFDLDYAYTPYGDLGDSQQVSLIYLFGERAAPAPLAVTPKPGPVLSASPIPSSKPATFFAAPAPGATPAPTPEPEKLKLFFSLPGEPETPVAPNREWNRKLAHYQQAIARDPTNATAWYELGLLYYRADKKAEAMQCFEQVSRLKPGAESLEKWLDQFRVLEPAPLPSPSPVSTPVNQNNPE
jgi:tetratricopeptide (TPR) repeat protein